jgi:hypothetical protein
MDAEAARIVAELLDRVVKGEIEPKDALEQWPQTHEAEPVLGTAWHDLMHFAADDDIRRKDKRYADYQIDLLRKRIAEIKEMHNLP